MGGVSQDEQRRDALRSLGERATQNFLILQAQHPIGLVTVGPELYNALRVSTSFNGQVVRAVRWWCGVRVLLDPDLYDEFEVWEKVN